LLGQEYGFGDLLFSQKILYVADEFRGNDGLSSQHPQPFQKGREADDGAQNDGVHENTPFDDEINHAQVSWNVAFQCWFSIIYKKI
jgi:hypothetical protein